MTEHGHVDVDAFASGTLRGDHQRLARAHLDECERCRRRHEKMTLAFRALAGDLDVPSPLEHEAILAGVLDAVAPQKPSPWRTLLASPWRLAVPVTALAAVALVVLAGTPPVDDEEFRARGSKRSPAAPAHDSPRLRAFCATGGRAVPVLARGACDTGGTVVVELQGAAKGDTAHAFLRDARGELREAAAETPLALERGTLVDVPGAASAELESSTVLDAWLPLEGAPSGDSVVVVVLCRACTRSAARATVLSSDAAGPSGKVLELPLAVDDLRGAKP